MIDSKQFMALRVIWQYMDRSVTKKILYGRSFRVPYNIFLVTDRQFLFSLFVFVSAAGNYFRILHFTFLFSLFVFVTTAGHYFRIWTGQVPALFQIKSIIQQIVHVTSGHMAVYGPVRNQKILYTSGPCNIFLVTDRSIYSHMTFSAMNYLLYICQTQISIQTQIGIY